MKYCSSLLQNFGVSTDPGLNSGLEVIFCIILLILVNIKKERGGKQEGIKRERERGEREDM